MDAVFRDDADESKVRGLTPEFTIRRAVAADAATVAELAERTFADWFGPHNRAEDMEAHRARTYGEALQRRELEDPDWATLLVESLLTESDSRAIGYAQLRRGVAPPCVTGERAIEILRFYVDRAFHGQGIAQALMDASIRTARDLGGDTLWLGVWERNPRAIAFYGKCGFHDRGSHPYLVGSDLQTDRVMVRSIYT